MNPDWTVQCNLWNWEILMLRGNTGDRESAETALATAGTAARRPFEAGLVELCRGRATADAVLGSAMNEGERFALFYYVGALALVEGRDSDARVWFQRCRDTGIHGGLEFDLAGWHLERLAAD